ncbi:peptidase domain-containing ABC transporter [Prescottella agglutinans]|uniref:peptidase domain-containing ABC transporter n=1 Tax=Prescottella agglutinans TaxID=1644129 RepID=UPI003D956F4F
MTQSGFSDCGAACLAMILGFHGAEYTVQEVTNRLGVARDGLTALALVDGARLYGLEVRAFGRSAVAVRSGDTALPAIVHWEHNHFVVVEHITARSVSIVDPAAGRRRLSHDDFDAAYSGVAIEFGPGDVQPRRRPGGSPWWRGMLALLFAHRRALLAQVVAASVVLQAVGMALPLLSAVLIDRVIPDHDTTMLMVTLAVLVAGAVGYLGVGLVRSVVLVRLRSRIDADVTRAVVERLLRLPFGYFTRRGTSDVVQRVGSISAIRELVTGQVVAALLDGPLAIVYLVAVWWAAPQLGATLSVLAAVQILLLLWTGRRVAERGQQELRSQAVAEGRLIEAVGGIETVKACAAEPQIARHWEATFDRAVSDAAASARLQGAIDAALTALRVASPAALMWIGATSVLAGDQSLGRTIALNGIALAALTPIGSLLGSAARLQTAGAHLERLRDILEEDAEQHGRVVVPAPPLRGEIALRGVGFRYDPRAPWVLRDVDLDVPAGATIALVGRSGSGKSTLARLLLGLYEPAEGSVLFDGLDAATLDAATLRSQFGVVTQDCVLFTGSIAQNIALGDPAASRERIVAAARTACIHDEIEAMPMGYETVLCDGGGLSGGQRQRIALARALLTGPRILLLDEATSALDARTEAAVAASLERLGQTRIVIAHRLSTVRDADLILVVERGRVVERGDHPGLLAADGAYARLVSGQN